MAERSDVGRREVRRDSASPSPRSSKLLSPRIIPKDRIRAATMDPLRRTIGRAEEGRSSEPAAFSRRADAGPLSGRGHSEARREAPLFAQPGGMPESLIARAGIILRMPKNGRISRLSSMPQPSSRRSVLPDGFDLSSA
jgi:hypothetical protein